MARVELITVLALLATLLCGCDRGEGSRKFVACSMQNLTNPFFTVIGKHLEKELAKSGYDLLLVSAEGDVSKQQNQIKDFILKGAAAIVLNPRDSKAIGPAIVEANRADIPVFTVDIACLDDTAKVTGHVGTDNYGGGKLAGEAMIEALGEGGGNIVVLDYPLVESCIERVKGFKEVIAAHNEGRTAGRIDIVAQLPSGGSRDVGHRSTEDALQSHPDIVGIFAINDPSALGARAALERAGKTDQVRIIGFDGQPEGKQAIKEGKIYADPIQFPDRMGVEVARAIVKYYEGEPVEPVHLIPTRLYRKADGEADPELE